MSDLGNLEEESLGATRPWTSFNLIRRTRQIQGIQESQVSPVSQVSQVSQRAKMFIPDCNRFSSETKLDFESTLSRIAKCCKRRECLDVKDLLAKNLFVKNANFFGPVNQRIGGRYVVGEDAPNIQSVLNLVNSGLKPDSNVTIVLNPGTYHESLFVDTDLSDPTINDPGTDFTSTTGRGLRIEGDPRPIATMSYINGGYIRTDPSFTTNNGLNSLGTLNAKVTLSNLGNTLTVTASVGNSPSFSAAGLIPGDIFSVQIDGIIEERTIVSVSGNTITYDGVSLDNINIGTSISFFPNVTVIASNPDFILIVLSGAIEVTGVRFVMDPQLTNQSLYATYVEGNSILYASRILIDARNNQIGNALLTFAGGQFLVNLADGNVTGHITILGGYVESQACSPIGGSGNYYIIMNTGTPALGGLFVNNQSIFNAASLQVVGGARSTRGIVTLEQNTIRISAIFAAFNCTDGILLSPQTRFVDTSLYTITNCNRGIVLNNAQFTNSGAGPAFGQIPSITNTGIAIFMTLASRFDSNRDILLSGNQVNFQVSVQSVLNIPNSTIAPFNIFNYQTDSNFEPTFETQTIYLTGVPVTITLNTSLISPDVISNKVYRLYNIGVPFQNRLVLEGPSTFIGVGHQTGIIPVATFDGINVGEGLTFIVIPGQVPLVQVISSTGVTFG